MTAVKLVTLADEKARARGAKWTGSEGGRIFLAGPLRLCPLEVAGESKTLFTAVASGLKLGLSAREITIIMDSADNMMESNTFSAVVRKLMVETFDFEDGKRPAA